ncbi:MAG: hypothetical protein HFF39_09185 [Lawsonibacter sp.]|nr:hypothetical protein [Lawsonibacter sp.]
MREEEAPWSATAEDYAHAFSLLEMSKLHLELEHLMTRYTAEFSRVVLQMEAVMEKMTRLEEQRARELDLAVGGKLPEEEERQLQERLVREQERLKREEEQLRQERRQRKAQE